MDIIEFLREETKQIHEFKAPKNQVFLVNQIDIVVLQAVSTYVLVLNDFKVDEPLYDNLLEYAERCLVIMNPSVFLNEPINVFFPEPHRTKYLTIIKEEGKAMFVHVKINVSLAKATQDELVYEYLKKVK